MGKLFFRRKKAVLISEWIQLCGQIIAIFFAIKSCFFFGLEQFKPFVIIDISMAIFGMIITCLMFISCLLEKSNQTRITQNFMLLLTLEIGSLLTSILSWLYDGVSEFYLFNQIANYIFYLNGILDVMLLWHIVFDLLITQKSPIMMSISSLIYFLGIVWIFLLFGNITNGYYFTIDKATGIYTRTPKTNIICFLYSYLVLIITILFMIKHEIPGRVKVLTWLYIAPPVICAIITIISNLSATYVGLLISYLFMYASFYRERGRLLVQKENEIKDAEIQMMISQIQPHFLYNTLTTIRSLCNIDPQLATKTIENFSLYLRGNLDFIRTTAPVSFEKELEYTQKYAEIEMIRFENIAIEYKIEDDDFMLPALTLQPLVENAIRHGIRIRENGKVTIHTYFENDRHIISIRDNGIGFNIADLNRTKGIGIKNVQKRLAMVVNGTLKINSAVDKGTEIIIIIPDEE